MDRYYEMTPEAQQFLWCKLSGGTNHIPTQWLVKGDAKDGYKIMHLDENECGFDLFPDNKVMRSFSSVKTVIDEINAGKTSYMHNHLSVGTGAWANHPIPQTA